MLLKNILSKTFGYDEIFLLLCHITSPEAFCPRLQLEGWGAFVWLRRRKKTFFHLLTFLLTHIMLVNKYM